MCSPFVKQIYLRQGICTVSGTLGGSCIPVLFVEVTILKKLILTLSMAVILLASASNSNACIRPPKGLPAIDNGAQRGLVFWHDGYQHLVMQPGYSFDTDGLDSGQLDEDGMVKGFDKVAWLIPLPSMPDLYKEAPASIFKDLDTFTEVTQRIPDEKPEGGKGADVEVDGKGKGDSEITFNEAIDVGDYSIQPIKAVGEAGQKQLAEWLKKAGFSEIDERIIRFYVQRNYVWLTVKLSAEGLLKKQGNLEPLHMAYASKAPSYPLKISDKGGAFDIELWVVTQDEIDLTKAKSFGLVAPEQHDDFFRQSNRYVGYGRLPESVRGLVTESKKMLEARRGKVWVYRLQGRNIEGEDGLDLGMLQDDLYFEFKKNAAKKPKEDIKIPEEKPADNKDSPGEKPEDTAEGR